MISWYPKKILDHTQCNISATIDGIRVLDPRDGTFKLSTNPALVLYDLVVRGMIVAGEDVGNDFKSQICLMADYCEKEIKGQGIDDEE